jgi:hypothetical protein
LQTSRGERLWDSAALRQRDYAGSQSLCAALNGSRNHWRFRCDLRYDTPRYEELASLLGQCSSLLCGTFSLQAFPVYVEIGTRAVLCPLY